MRAESGNAFPETTEVANNGSHSKRLWPRPLLRGRLCITALCSSSSRGSSLAKMLRKHTGGASRTTMACFFAGGGRMPVRTSPYTREVG